MPAIPKLSSDEECKIADKYFPGIFFKPLKIEEKGILPVETKRLPLYKIKEHYDEETKTLNLYEMAGEKPFSSLFPEDEEINLQECKQIAQDIRSQPIDNRLKGGVPRFYIEKKDDKFIEQFNKMPETKIKIKREAPKPKERFSNKQSFFNIPEQFFDFIDSSSTYAVYDSDNDIFRWDFSNMLYFRPSSIYDAYLRFGHAKYTIRYIGAEGYKDVLDFVSKRKSKEVPSLNALSKKIENKFIKDKDFTEAGIEEVKRYHKLLRIIQEALESGKSFIPDTLDDIGSKFNFLINNKYPYLKDKTKKVDDYKYDDGDERNIGNYLNKLKPLVSQHGTEKEKQEYEKALNDGPYSLVPFMYFIIVNLSTANPDISKEFNDYSKQIISGLYRQAFDAVSLNKKVNDESQDELQDILEDDAEDFTDLINDMADYQKYADNLDKIVLKAIKKAFSTSVEGEYDNFLKHVKHEKPFNELYEDLLECRNKIGNYHERVLFIEFCDIQGYDINDKKLIGPVHTDFANKIDRIFTILINKDWQGDETNEE